MHQRLLLRPRLAISILLPPSGQMWIAVESSSQANVVELCLNLSTIRHPLDISLVPVEERVAWLNWKSTRPRLVSPSWARLHRRSVLMSLDLERNLFKYAGDLAFVYEVERGSKVVICLVPRLPIKTGDGKKRRTLHLPRLLDPKTEGTQDTRMMDLNIWRFPTRELELVKSGIYRISKWKNSDDYMPPFAIFTVPHEALHASSAVPTLRELRLFTQGMAVGAAQFEFLAPSPEFLRWTYERYAAAPLEIGNKVEVDLKQRMVRGIIEDIQLEEVIVRVEGTEDTTPVDPQHVRRFYEIGDTVKVIKSWNIDREGWVLAIKDDEVDIFDRISNEEV